jgi:FeS assembly SUF system regulator
LIRISKLTDYGILLLSSMARNPERTVHTARDLAQGTNIPLPTVGKVLKTLSHGDFLASERGVNGGYRLTRPADQISIAQIIQVLEGPISLTDCAGSGESCGIEHVCSTRSNWRRISDVVRRSLEGLSLADMSQPLPKRFGAVQPRPQSAAPLQNFKGETHELG